MYFLVISPLLAVTETMPFMIKEALTVMVTGGFCISISMRIVGDFHTQTSKSSQKAVCGKLQSLLLTAKDQVSSENLRALATIIYHFKDLIPPMRNSLKNITASSQSMVKIFCWKQRQASQVCLKSNSDNSACLVHLKTDNIFSSTSCMCNTL